MTPAKLKSDVLKHLQITPGGSSDAADDVKILTDNYASLHKMLLTKVLVTWSLTENIPAEAQQPLVMMLAAVSANDFSIPDPRYSRLQLEGALDLAPPSLAERQLRKALSAKRVSSPLVSEYF